MTLLCVSTVRSQSIYFIDNLDSLPVENVEVMDVETHLTYGVSDKNGMIPIDGYWRMKTVFFSHSEFGFLKYDLAIAKVENGQILIILEHLTNTYDEVVASGSRFKEKKKDLVQKIQLVSRKEIENLNQSSTADLVAGTGNVMVQKSQLGGGSPIIRGFETNKILLVVDGVRMNNAIYRGGHLQNVITLDNAIMEKMEVVYGPGSVVYGSDALGGVLSFTTKNPLLSNTSKMRTSGGAYIRYNSANTGYSGHAHVSLGRKKFGSLTSFTYSNFGDLRQGAKRSPSYPSFGTRNWYVERINGIDSMIVNIDTNLQIGSAYQQYDVLQKFLYAPKKGVEHVLNLQYSTSSDVPRFDRLTQWKNGGPRYAEWYYGPQKRLFGAYHFNLVKKVKMFDQLQFVTAYQNIEESRITRNYRSDDKNYRIETIDVMTLNLDLAKKISRHELRYGVEGTYNAVGSEAFTENIVTGAKSSLDTRYPDGGSSMFSAAAYFTHKIEFGNNKWVLNDGIRYSHVGLRANFIDTTYFPFPYSNVAQDHDAVNGNLGLVFMPGKGWRLIAGVSSGFRAPNVDDLSKVFESVPGNVIVPNKDIKPEYTYNAELGVSKLFAPGVTVSVNGYYTELVNAITVQPTTFNGLDSIVYDNELSQVTTTMNAGSAYLYGVEGGVRGELNSWLNVFATVNYTYGRIRKNGIDFPLDHIPPVFGKMNFNIHYKKFSSDFFLNYSGWKRFEDYNLVGEDNFANATVDGMPSWYTINARLNYKMHKNLSIQIACENIFDQNYRVFASNISAPGRNFILTLRSNF